MPPKLPVRNIVQHYCIGYFPRANTLAFSQRLHPWEWPAQDLEQRQTPAAGHKASGPAANVSARNTTTTFSQRPHYWQRPGFRPQQQAQTKPPAARQIHFLPLAPTFDEEAYCAAKRQDERARDRQRPLFDKRPHSTAPRAPKMGRSGYDTTNMHVAQSPRPAASQSQFQSQGAATAAAAAKKKQPSAGQQSVQSVGGEGETSSNTITNNNNNNKNHAQGKQAVSYIVRAYPVDALPLPFQRQQLAAGEIKFAADIFVAPGVFCRQEPGTVWA